MHIHRLSLDDRAYSYGFRSMGTQCSLTLFVRSRELADMSAAIAVAEAERINDKYSRYRANSVLSELNRVARERETCPPRRGNSRAFGICLFLLQKERYALRYYCWRIAPRMGLRIRTIAGGWRNRGTPSVDRDGQTDLAIPVLEFRDPWNGVGSRRHL
jgi:hypothetical protein